MGWKVGSLKDSAKRPKLRMGFPIIKSLEFSKERRESI